MAEYSWYRSYDTQDYWSTDYHQCSIRLGIGWDLFLPNNSNRFLK